MYIMSQNWQDRSSILPKRPAVGLFSSFLLDITFDVNLLCNDISRVRFSYIYPVMLGTYFGNFLLYSLMLLETCLVLRVGF